MEVDRDGEPNETFLYGGKSILYISPSDREKVLSTGKASIQGARLKPPIMSSESVFC